MMTKPDDAGASQSKWHFDRTINVTVLLGFLGMIGSGTWFAATTNARIEHLEQGEAMRAPQADRLTRLEVQFQSLQQTVTVGLDDIKHLLRTPPEQRR